MELNSERGRLMEFINLFLQFCSNLAILFYNTFVFLKYWIFTLPYVQIFTIVIVAVFTYKMSVVEIETVKAPHIKATRKRM